MGIVYLFVGKEHVFNFDIYFVPSIHCTRYALVHHTRMTVISVPYYNRRLIGPARVINKHAPRRINDKERVGSDITKFSHYIKKLVDNKYLS